MFKVFFLKPLFKNIRKNKKLFIMMGIAIISMIFIVSTFYSLNSEIINLKKNIDNRIIQVQKLSKEFDIKKISSDKRINDFYIDYNNFTLHTDDIYLNAIYSNVDLYQEKILKGRKININENNVIVLPDIVLINNIVYDLKKYFGKTIEFDLYDDEVQVLKYRAKVIGIYKGNKLNSNIYISKNDYVNFLGKDLTKYKKMNIVVNNYDDLNDVSDIFLKSYNVYFDSTVNTELLSQKINLYNVLFLCICLVFVILLIIFNVILKNIEFDLNNDIILLRILGFSNSFISLSVFKILLILFFVSYFISIVISSFIFFKFNLLKNIMYSYFFVLVVCLITICVSCIKLYYYLKKKKIFY